MKLTQTIVAAAAFAAIAFAAHPVRAQLAATITPVVGVTPGAGVAAETTKTVAAVVAIELSGRTVMLKDATGKVFEVVAADEVKTLAQLRIGDRVTVEVAPALGLDLRKAGAGMRAADAKDSASRAPALARRGVAAGRQVAMVATVATVDAKKKRVTLRSPAGNAVDLLFPDGGLLKNVKKGDAVEALYVDAFAVSIEPVAAAAAAAAGKAPPKK